MEPSMFRYVKRFILVAMWLLALSASSPLLGGVAFGADSLRLRPHSLKEYRDFAMSHDGSAARGKVLFFSEQRTACSKCHSVDGKSSKAGPDLFAVGDKFPRSELIRAVLEP